MSSRVQVVEGVRRLGKEFGEELAAALVLASSRPNADRALKRQMARLVLDQIATAIEKLRQTGVPAELVAHYEGAAREGVRDELLKSHAIAAQLERRAA